MAEILIDTNSPIKHRLFWKGEPTDSDVLPHVHVYDITEDHTLDTPIDPDTLLITLNAEKVETDFGVYQVFLPLSYTARPREFKFIWNYEVEGNDVTKTIEVYVVKPYTDITQAIDELGFGTDPSDPSYKTYAQLQSAERYARNRIEDFTTQTFSEREFAYAVYGNDTDIISLPEHITEIHKIYANDILLVDNLEGVNNWIYTPQITESGYGVRVNRQNVVDNTVYVANGMVPADPAYSGHAFVDGTRYVIEGKFGWTEVPQQVEQACIELMGHYFEKDNNWKDHYMKKISTFDWNFEYDSAVYSGTGCAYADKLLSPFVITQMVII
jgi:hypothetical protein